MALQIIAGNQFIALPQTLPVINVYALCSTITSITFSTKEREENRTKELLIAFSLKFRI